MSSRETSASWIPVLIRAPRAPAGERLLPSSVTRADARRVSVTPLEWAILLASVTWVVALAFFTWPALRYAQFNSNSTGDSAFSALAGRLVQAGQVPYVGFWDHKPPLIYLIDAFALLLSGGEVWGLWVVTVVALLATLGMTWRAWQRIVGPSAAVIGMTWVAFSVGIVAPYNLTEGFALPLQAAAMLLLTRWTPLGRRSFAPGFALGALGSLGFLLRPNLIGTPAVVMLTMTVGLLLTHRTRKLTWLFAGALVGTAVVVTPVLLWLGANGALGAFWDQVFHYNAVYSAASLQSRARAAFEGMVIASAYGTLLLPVVGWLLAIHRLAARRRGATPKPALLLGLLWAPIELALAAVPGRTYMHYFATLLLPLGFLTAIAACEIFGTVARLFSPERMRRWRRDVTVVVCGAIAVAPIGRTLLLVRDTGLHNERAQQVDETARYIRAHSAPGSRLLVWGQASDVYLLADRAPASRFIYPLAMLTPRYADSALVETFLDDVRTSAPPLIVDATPGSSTSDDLVPTLSAWNPQWRYPESGVAWWEMTPALRRFYDHVAAAYVVVDRVGPQQWVIYARRGDLQR